MALPASGPISLLDIANEFGGAAPHAINEYYGVAAGIPASGTISLADFYGAAASFTATLVRVDSNPRGYNAFAGKGSLTPTLFQGFDIIIIESGFSFWKQSQIFSGKISIIDFGGGPAPPDDLWSTMHFSGTNITITRTTHAPSSSINANNSSVRDWAIVLTNRTLYDALGFGSGNQTQTLTVLP